MIRPLQTTIFPRIGSQQATAMQSGVLPATVPSQAGFDITTLMPMMITMMIVVMMMKMMTGAMQNL